MKRYDSSQMYKALNEGASLSNLMATVNMHETAWSLGIEMGTECIAPPSSQIAPASAQYPATTKEAQTAPTMPSPPGFVEVAA